ncbi:MAG: SCP2 sterol-binding domain-containing protein, partial [Nitrospinales bacterium]
PIPFDPCVTCNLCVAACPVGAIGSDGEFDFMGCMTHNYREFMGGFQDWVEGMVSSKNVADYRSKFQDSETVSMWQSLSFGSNYKAAYCMAVCPAGEDILPRYLANKKEYVKQVVKPLKDKKEPVYVLSGTRGEQVARRNANKDARVINTPIRPASISYFLRGIQLSFNPLKAGTLDLKIHFEFTGKENKTATVTIADKKIQVQEGLAGKADLRVKADAEIWLKVANKELSGLRTIMAVLTGQLQLRGNPILLAKFQDCVSA